MKKLLFTLALTLLFLGVGCEIFPSKESASIGGPTICNPTQGCTGIGSASSSDVGKALVVSDDSPFTYTLQTVSSTGGSGSSTILQTNGTPNGSQALLNLKNGTNVTISDDGVGGVTINSSGSGGGSNWEVDGGYLTPTSSINVLLPQDLLVEGYVTSSRGFYTSSTITTDNHSDYIQQVFKTDDDFGDYTITQRSFPNNASSRLNQSLRIGFNKASGGEPLNPLSPSMGIDFESHFLPTTTDPVFEFHVPSIVDTGVEIRPISVLYHYLSSSSSPGTAEISFDSERVNFNNSSGTQYTLLTPENLYLVGNGLQQNVNNINWFRQKNAAGDSNVEIARVDNQDRVVLAPSGNAVHAPGNISTSGTLFADDNFKQYVYTKVVTTTVGGAEAFTQITNGAFSANVDIWLTIHSEGFAQSKRYSLPLSYNGTGGAWQKVLPLSTTGVYSGNNTEIDVNVNNEIATFRLRRQAGTTTGTAYITFAVGSDIENSAVSSVSTAYPGATITGNYAPTSITQNNGFTGINNDTPSTYLHVLGATEQIRSGYDTSNYLSITTGNTGTTTLVAAGTSPIISIPGTDARTGQYNLLRIGNATQNFSGANDANAAYLIEQFGVGFNINGGGIASYPGLRFGFQKEGSWNKSSEPSSGVSGAFVVHTSSGGGASSLPTISEKFRISGLGFVGIGTSTPTSILALTASTTAMGGLTFGGDTNLYRSATNTLKTDDGLFLTSQLYDSLGSAGSLGNVLQTTGTSTRWVTTSSLGITGGGGSGSPGGSNTQIQVNQDGTFAGYAGLTFSSSTAVLSLLGTAASLTANPRMNFGFIGDADPTISYLNYDHDNIAMTFDAWFNGSSWVSSNAGSNFAIYKNNNELSFGYNSGTAKGSTFAGFDLENGLNLSNTGGVGIGKSPTAGLKLEVLGTASTTNMFVSSALNVSGMSTLGGLTITGHTDFTTASGTSITSTNISVSGGLSMLPGSGASVYLNGGNLYLTTGGANIQSGGTDVIALVGESGFNAELDLNSLSQSQTFTFPDNTGTFALTDDIPGLQTNGTPNANQTLLNLIAGSNINLTDDGLGGITIDATGGGSSSLTNTLIAFGNTDNTITSSTALSFDTASLRLIVNGTVSSTNALFLNSTSTRLFGTNGTFTNATTTNLRVSGVTSLAGLSFTNATGTGRLLIATTTITGGLFQTGMSNCNADNETLGYNATTGKFECGDDDTTVSVVSTTNANTRGFTDISPATMVDNNTTEIFNDTTRPNIQPQSVNNSVLVTLDFQLRGGGTSDADAAVRVVRENDPGSTTPTCDLTSDAQVGSSIVGGSLATAFFTNTTDIQTARLSVVDSPATTSPVYYTICSSASSTLTSVPVSLALHVSLTEIQGSGGGTSREYTHIVTSTGSSAWTKPATSTGFIGVRVWTVGGGGGGGGSGTAGNIGAGGGGAGSGYKTIMAASLSATTSVTVGAEGTAGAVGNNDGVAGGTSSFGSHISCTGGGGGNDGGSGAGGGAAGTCTGADLSGSGIAGQSSGAYTDSYRGYGGSAGVDQGFPLSEPSDALSRIIPAGGLLGMYAGAGATRPPSWDANSRTGGSGAYFGAGGSGGQEVGAGGDVAGGAGKQGVVVIQELYQ